MAKRKAKKPTRRTSTAKPSRPRRMPDALNAEQIFAAIDANWERVQDRRRRRDADMQRLECRMPEEVRWFLGHVFREPSLIVQPGWTLQDLAAITRALWDAYEQGCEQGYIEGRVAELASRRQASDAMNLRKRAHPVEVEEEVGGGKVVRRELDMDMDMRDAVVFCELPLLKREHGAEAAELLMAKRFGITDRHVRNIYLEQLVLRDRSARVRAGMSEAEAAEFILKAYGVDKHGKPSEPRQASVRKILEKGRLRNLPEVP